MSQIAYRRKNLIRLENYHCKICFTKSQNFSIESQLELKVDFYCRNVRNSGKRGFFDIFRLSNTHKLGENHVCVVLTNFQNPYGRI